MDRHRQRQPQRAVPQQPSGAGRRHPGRPAGQYRKPGRPAGDLRGRSPPGFGRAPALDDVDTNRQPAERTRPTAAPRASTGAALVSQGQPPQPRHPSRPMPSGRTTRQHPPSRTATGLPAGSLPSHTRPGRCRITRLAAQPAGRRADRSRRRTFTGTKLRTSPGCARSTGSSPRPAASVAIPRTSRPR